MRTVPRPGAEPHPEPAAERDPEAETRTPAEQRLRQEPDYRFTLANERTFLAWIRTSLALLAAAVALGHLVPDLGPVGVRKAASVVLAALAMITAVSSVVRWRRIQTAVDRSEPVPRAVAPWVLSVVLLILAGLIVALLVTGRVSS